jgi:hypothetical protein
MCALSRKEDWFQSDIVSSPQQLLLWLSHVVLFGEKRWDIWN